MTKNQLIKTKQLCTVAMLIALSFILGAFSLRIGVGIKVSFKFLPVFLCSALFGPLMGGLCGALSDVVSYIVNPVGAFLWQYTLIEFLYGVSFGLFFYKKSGLNVENIIRLVICISINTVLLSTLANAYILKDLIGRTFIETIIYRTPSTIINMLFRYVGIILVLRFMPLFKKLQK